MECLNSCNASGQIPLLLSTYPQQKSVILFACRGEWQSCRMAHKDQIDDEDANAGQDDEDNGEREISDVLGDNEDPGYSSSSPGSYDS